MSQLRLKDINSSAAFFYFSLFFSVYSTVFENVLSFLLARFRSLCVSMSKFISIAIFSRSFSVGIRMHLGCPCFSVLALICTLLYFSGWLSVCHLHSISQCLSVSVCLCARLCMFKVIPNVIGFVFLINQFSVILEVTQECLVPIGLLSHSVVSNCCYNRLLIQANLYSCDYVLSLQW